MILSAQTIRRLCIGVGSIRSPLISPFVERSRVGGMSYGLSSAGYDIRIAETIWIMPKTYRLASTVERFCIPDDLVYQVVDKSSWARRGLSAFNTVAEPGWCGTLTLELFNASWLPKRIKAGTPIAQILFMELDEATEQPYCGKYQNQKAGPQPAIFEPA